MALVERGTLELGTTATVAARRRPAADRRRRHRRAPARPSVRDRRLPRRGRPRRRRGVRPARCRCTRWRRPRTTCRCSTASRPSSPPVSASPTTTAAYVVLALLAERASGRRLPRAGAHARLRARGHDRHGVPALRRAAGRGGAGLPGRRRSADERPAPPGRRCRRRRRVLDRGATCTAFWEALFAGRIVGLDSVAEMVRPRSDVPRRVQALRPRLPPRTRPATRSGWRDTTRASRSAARTRAVDGDHLHRHRQLERRCLAGREAARRAARLLSGHSGRLGTMDALGALRPPCPPPGC